MGSLRVVLRRGLRVVAALQGGGGGCVLACVCAPIYLDVIHIAIVCGKRDLLELRIGSIRSLDLSDLIGLSASQQGQCDESIWPAA